VTLGYFARLFCAAAAVFFALHAVLGLVVSLLADSGIRAAERTTARRGAALLLALRLAPVGISLAVVLGLLVPSYLRLEPVGMAEQVGWPCLVVALAAIGACAASIGRAWSALTRSYGYIRECRGSCRELTAPGSSGSLWVVPNGAPQVALAGIVRPRLVISETVLHALPAAELQVAIRHERAHRASFDNLKRLLLLLAPDDLPGVSGFAKLERAWSTLTEWAADDRAARDEYQSLLLAEALLRVSRMSACSAAPALTRPLLGDRRNLTARVDRLLAGASRAAARGGTGPWVGLGVALSALLAVLAIQPAMLEAAHNAMEVLIR